jgi:hypothetical protein
VESQRRLPTCSLYDALNTNEQHQACLIFCADSQILIARSIVEIITLFSERSGASSSLLGLWRKL